MTLQPLSESLVRDRAEHIPLVVSNGVGVDSAAVCVELVARGIKPQLIQFADTGCELPDTYQYLPVINGFLRDNGMPPVTTVHKNSKHLSLYHNCLNNQTLPSLAFGFKGCSLKWKVDPMNVGCNRWTPARDCWKQGGRVIKIIGYDYGDRDQERFAHSFKARPDRKYAYWYPLIEWKLDREACKAVIRNAGLPVPCKSSCFMCPARKPHEVQNLARDYPSLMELAAILEVMAKAGKHGLKSTRGLGRRWSWLERLAEENPEFATKYQNLLNAWRQAS